MIDVATGEYGHEYIDKMLSLVDNGRCFNWLPYNAVVENNYKNQQKCLEFSPIHDEFEEEINPKHLRARSSNWQQFCILYKRRTIQMWRDSVFLLKIAQLIHFSTIIHFCYCCCLFLPELHETTNLHDIFLGYCCWWHIPRHWK